MLIHSRRTIRYILPVILAALFTLDAHAQTPSCQSRKSSVAAVGTYIDRSMYVDGSIYEQEKPGIDTVKVGLSYGNECVEAAYLSNVTGSGFEFGYYDEQRIFHALGDTDIEHIAVVSDVNTYLDCGLIGRWHVMYDGEYSSFKIAKAAASGKNAAIAYSDGTYRLLCGSFSSQYQAEYHQRYYGLKGTAYCGDGTGVTVADSYSGSIIFEYEGTSPLSVRPKSSGKAETYYNGLSYYGDFEISRTEYDYLQVINYVALEDYVKGVVPYEMSASWPFEALKAQAVCARTYAVYNADGYPEYGFDVTDDTQSQVYRGTLYADEITDRAVDETAGEYVRYEGRICNIYYFASDGGATESCKDVFDRDEPYLIGKPDPFEDAIDYTGRNWIAERSVDGITWNLQQAGYDVSYIRHIVPEYSACGNVIAMTYTDIYGRSIRLTGRESYALIGLYNCRFEVIPDDGWFVFKGDGWGHNCGLSQWGAYAMASVYGYDYEDIIRFYFTGVYIG